MRVPGAQSREARGEASGEGRGEAPGLYVHVPFCLSKCPYCGFYSEVGTKNVSTWLRAVLREAAFYADRFDPFHTVYLGGGTPSALSHSQLQRLLSGLLAVLPFQTDVEITIELNPGDVDRRRAKGWLDLGVSRASVGVQSFDDQVLTFLGRRHDAEQAWDALMTLRSVGFRSIGLDLIWGVPGQSDQRCLDSVQRALSFGPEHLSCYELTVESETPLHRKVLKGDVVRLGEEHVADLAAEIWGLLEAAGYDHYEVSNFAKGHRHRSEHNTKYWRHVPYLGLGPSAHSFDGQRRWANVKPIQNYVRAVMSGQRPIVFEEALSDEQKKIERIALGIRTSRGVDVSDVPAGLAQRLVAEGWVTLNNERLLPTRSGLLAADGLASFLVGAIDSPA